MRLRVFNGSHLTLPSSSQLVALRPHQKNAVWRIVQSDNTLLAHAVGAGKTYTMVAAAIELKRLGLATKPMFVVPNHMLAQFSSELLTLYPTANILVAGKDDFEASRRARLFSRIATGNWDAVIVTHSSFEKIPVSAETRRDFIAEQIREIEKAIREQRADRGTRLVKELERVKKRLEAKLETLSADHKKDNTLTFEELGIDRLFIDEAHKFKNLFYVTKMTRVAGLPQTASERAFDLFLKVQHIQARNKGGGVVFATGTPISNTMAEMFTMQRYLQMSSAATESASALRFVGGHVRRDRDGDGAEPGRQRLSPAKPLRALRQCARADAAVPPGRRRADRGDAEAAGAEAGPRPAHHCQRAGDAGAEDASSSSSSSAWRRSKAARSIRATTTCSRSRPKAAKPRSIFGSCSRTSATIPDSKVNQAVEKIHQVWLDSAPAERRAARLLRSLHAAAGQQMVFRL